MCIMYFHIHVLVIQCTFSQVYACKFNLKASYMHYRLKKVKIGTACVCIKKCTTLIIKQVHCTVAVTVVCVFLFRLDSWSIHTQKVISVWRKFLKLFSYIKTIRSGQHGKAIEGI